LQFHKTWAELNSSRCPLLTLTGFAPPLLRLDPLRLFHPGHSRHRYFYISKKHSPYAFEYA